MICERFDLGGNAHLDTYRLNDSKEYNVGKKRPLVLVIPGGGFVFASDREAEPIAMKFNSIGCHAAVLWYSCFDEYKCVPRQSLIESMKAVALIRRHAEEWLLDEDAIIVCGFSAGGYIALASAIRWHEHWLDEETDSRPEERKVNLCISCYSVADAKPSEPGDYGFASALCEHPNTSNERVFGYDSPTEEQIKEVHLLHRIDPEYTPPMFIWHTFEDQLVDVMGSIELGKKLCEKGIPFELHIFEKGEHGLALCDRTTARKDSHKNSHVIHWFQLCEEWLSDYIDKPEGMYGQKASVYKTH